MGIRLKDMLGKCYWCFYPKENSFVTTSGVDDCWFDKNATFDELVAATDEYSLKDADETAFYLMEQYQKIGRSIKKVNVKKIDLKSKETVYFDDGEYHWYLKTSESSLCNTSGWGEVWRNPNATLAELVETTHESDLEEAVDSAYYSLEHWGEKLLSTKIKRIYLKSKEVKYIPQ